MWEVTEVFHLLDLVSCQRQEAVGEGRGAETELNHRTAGGREESTQHPAPLAKQPADEWGPMATWGGGSRVGLAGPSADNTLGLERSAPVLWGGTGSPSLSPLPQA